MKKKEALRLLSGMALSAMSSKIDVVICKDGEESEVDFDLVSESVAATLVYACELLENKIDSLDDFEVGKELSKLYKAIIKYHYLCFDDDDTKAA